MVDFYESHKRRWQNLIYRKCPDCNTKLIEKGKAYDCPDCDFFIFKTKLVEILTDKNHAAIRYMHPKERRIIKTALNEMGIVYEDVQNNTLSEKFTKISDLAEELELCWEMHDKHIIIRKCQCD